MHRILTIYPRAWRARYGDELQAVIETAPLGLRERVDLLRGAVDAHLHPTTPSVVPVAAALTASALAFAHALALAAQPAPTDWPGYLEDALPLITASVALLVPVIVGLWLKLGDADGRLGRMGLVLALTGHLGWLALLLAAAARITYGPETAVAATVAMTGTVMLGIALVGHGRATPGTLLAAAGLAGVAPPAIAWLGFAAAWTGIAIWLLADLVRRQASRGGPRVA